MADPSSPRAGTIRPRLGKAGDPVNPRSVPHCPEVRPGPKTARVLVVDDDDAFRRMLVRGLAHPSYEIDEARDSASAIARLAKSQYEVVLTDFRMDGPTGAEVLRAALGCAPPPVVILMSGHGTIPIAVDAVQSGASDFVQKPFAIESMRMKIDRALELRRLKYQVDYLNRTQPDIYNVDRIIGAGGALQKVLTLVKKVARSNASILILGETGTGKELIAAAVHHNSDRANRAFIKVNCAALHDNLLESELFGHEKGAFTSADRQRIGRFEQANGGTLFLDEIGDMSPSTQAKVLRVLQQHEFERLGGSVTLKVDVRILAATNRNLGAMVRARTFREDLFYRLNVVSIEVPPLRERKEDIPALTEAFLHRLAGEMKKPVPGMDAAARSMLAGHDWPGNIRELENMLERAVLLAVGPDIGVDDLTIAHDRPREPVVF
jgi:DNA-binding NtrC family response regulator